MASRPVTHLQSVADVPPIPPVPDLLPAPLASVPIGKHFKITPTGLTVTGDPTFETCADFGELLRTLDRTLPFVIGDYCRYMGDRFGEQASQVLCASTGWSEKTLAVYTWMATKVAPAERRIEQGLGVKHHLAVAALPAAQQAQWLDKALGTDGECWPASRLTAALKADGAVPETFGFYVRCTSQAHMDRLVKLVTAKGGTV